MKKKARFIFIFTFLFCKLSSINCIGQPSIHHFVKHFGDVAPYNNFGVQLAFQDSNYLLFVTDNYLNIRTLKTYNSDLFGIQTLLNSYIDTAKPCNYYYDLISDYNLNYYLPTTRFNAANLNFGNGISELRKFTKQGAQLFSKPISDSSVFSTEFLGLCFGTDNYIYGCGANYGGVPFKVYPFICKTDTLANVIFFKADSLVLGGYNKFNDIVETTDSNFVVAGSWRWNSSFQGDKKIWLRKFSPLDGTIIWDKKQYLDSTAAGTEAAQGIKIVLANDSNLLVCGTAEGLDNSNYSFAAKFNPANGNKIWTYKFLNIDTMNLGGGNVFYPPYTGGSYINKTIPIRNKGYLLAGDFIFGGLFPSIIIPSLVKINESGIEEWRKYYFVQNPNSIGNRDTYIWDAVATNDGGFAMIGQTASNAFAVDVLFMKVTCNGDTAAPIAQFVPTVDMNNNSLVTIHNTSMFYDTCIFKFSDGSADVIKTNTDASSFTHTFPTSAANYSITCIAKACSNECDTISFAQIITNVFDVNSKQGYLQPPVPNPSMYATNIKYYLPNTTKKANLSVTNSLGEIVLQQNIEVEKHGSINLNIEALRSGIYLIHLITDIGVIGTRKLVVIK